MRDKLWMASCIGITRLLPVVLGACVIAGLLYGYHLFFRQPLRLDAPYTLVIAPGQTIHHITQALNAAHILPNERLFRWGAILKKYDRQLQVGEYIISVQATMASVLKMFATGQVAQYSLTLVEGWRFEEVMRAVQQHPKIKQTLMAMTADELTIQVGCDVPHLEGYFWADTYYFPAETTDVSFLKRACLSMQRKVSRLWEQRGDTVQLQSAYEAVVLASIIEKETHLPEEYAEISGVYQRRLSKKMRLQADPTVIYGLGMAYPGRLYRKHLNIASPYNTYKVYGLPPTPIAIPSEKALYAALHPDDSDTLYFVASAQGGHKFSRTLQEHNKAVSELRAYLAERDKSVKEVTDDDTVESIEKT